MFPFPEDLYFHREHTWVRRESENRYRVGVDEIFLRGLGGVQEVDLPGEGDELSQDEVCGMVRGKSGRQWLYAPLSGEIIDVNQDLYEDLTILLDDPYGYGWILLLDPSEPEEEFENLLHGEEALDWWQREMEARQNPPTSSPQPEPTALPRGNNI